MKTFGTPSDSTRQRVVLALIVAMLLITLGAEAETFLRERHDVVSLVWPMALLVLAIYWLRMFLRGWTRRFDIGEHGDESL